MKLLKRSKVAIALVAIILCGYGTGWAYDNPSRPHTDYTPVYKNSCAGNGGACHTLAKGSFLPAAIDTGAGTDFTVFCLSCHNTSGEAHERSAGTPSTNAYDNQTGLLVPGGYKGVSHSWNGVDHGAGTRTATDAAMEGTSHMPGGNRVTCQVCHQGMGKTREENIDWVEATSTDQLNYTFLGYTTTKQYLSQYIRVYRASTTTANPTNSRTKKGYLVDPSEYSYDYSTATITFGTAQTAGTKIYVDIAQPYFREGNAANALCLDCHNDRADSGVSHEPGTGANDHHPSSVSYGNISGLKSSADSNIYIEGGQVLCTSCHDVHNAVSGDGQLTRNANSSELCTDCHKTNGFDGYTGSLALISNHDGSKHTAPTECLECHTTHNTNNIMLIRNVINGKTINFQNFSGSNSFGNDTGSSVCEACHTATSYHLASGGGTGHNTGKNCISCHKHSTGFGAGGCTSCHGFPPPPAPTGWADTTGDAHASHMVHLNAAGFGFLTGAVACNECHGNGTGKRGDHDTTKDSAGIDTSTWGSWSAVGGNWGTPAFSIGTTIGKVNTSDDTCTNVSCHSAGGTRVWGGTTDCNGCHSYPTAGSNWTDTGHTVQYDGVSVTHLSATGFDPTTDSYVAVTTDPTKCGKCHYNSLGTDANHKNSTVNLNSSGNAACGGGNFTITVTAPGANVTCSNVKCHTAGKTTPNWY